MISEPARGDTTATESSPFRTALLLTLFLRLFYSLCAAWLTPHLVLDPQRIHSNELTDHLMQRGEGFRYALLGVWERFDTLWYIHIAQNGYDRPAAVVFPPLFPALIRLASALTGNPLAASLLVAGVSSFFLFWGFQKLLLLDLPAGTVKRALVLYAVWPAAFVFLCGYIESLVIALMIWAIYWGRQRRWWLAGIAVLAAASAKIVGILVIVPLAVLAWRERKWRTLPILLGLLGPALFWTWLSTHGLPLPSQAYATYWRTMTAMPWTTALASLSQVFVQGRHELGLQLILAAIAFTLSLARRIRLEYGAFAVATILFLLIKNAPPDQQQWVRYVLILFPAPANLALLLPKRGPFIVTAAILFLVNLVILWAFLEWFLVV
jgi:hypothetical protein